MNTSSSIGVETIPTKPLVRRLIVAVEEEYLALIGAALAPPTLQQPFSRKHCVGFAQKGKSWK